MINALGLARHDAQIDSSIGNMRDSNLITEIQINIWREIANARQAINICQCWILLGGTLRVAALKTELSKMISLGILTIEQDLIGINYYKAVFV